MTVRPVTRNRERTTFLGDIITAAVEGGIGYWSQVSAYQYTDEHGVVFVHCGEQEGHETCAVVHVVKDDESGYEDSGLKLDFDAIERGLKLIREGGVKLTPRHRNRLLVADRSNEAGQLDALDADIIVQAGLFGELVYA